MKKIVYERILDEMKLVGAPSEKPAQIRKFARDRVVSMRRKRKSEEKILKKIDEIIGNYEELSRLGLR
jgi:hypothetical protein